MSGHLTFAKFSRINRARSERWVGAAFTSADKSNEMMGEAGEAANFVKKLRRIELGLPGTDPGKRAELEAGLALELADVIICVDLLAARFDIDLADALAFKFNLTSEKMGFPERLQA